MKKIICLTLCLILTACMAISLTGCTESVFDGDYRQVESTDLVSTMQEIHNADTGVYIDYDKGIALSFNTNLVSPNTTQTVTFNLNSIKSNGSLKLQGSFSLRDRYIFASEANSTTGQVYYTDNYSDNFTYLTIKQGEDTVKIKSLSNFKNAVHDILVNFEPFFSSYSLYLRLQLDSGYQWYLDDTQELLKLKIEFNNYEMGECQAVWVYDSQYNLNAFLFDSSTTTTANGQETKAYARMSFESWSGEIYPPSDLDSYRIAQIEF